MPTQPIDPKHPHNDYAACLRLIADAAPGKPFVVAQLGQSLDGRIALPNGESRWINNDAALDHLHRLRAVVDAVVVGVGTAVADDPALTVRRVEGRSPARVVIDPSGRLHANARIFEADGIERIIITRPGIMVPPGITQICIGGAHGPLPPSEIISSLHARGLSRLLVEGGAQTVSAFIDAGAIDRLHVLVAPCLLGAGVTGLNLRPPDKLMDARRPPAAVHVLDGGDVLFDCNLKI